MKLKIHDLLNHLILNFVATPVTIAFSVVSIYSAKLSSNNICQKGTNFGMFLYEWVVLFSCEKIAICCIISILSILLFKFNRLVYFGTMMIVFDLLFSIAMCVLGALMITAHNNVDCTTQNANIWFISIFDILVLPLTIVYAFSYSPFYMKEEDNILG